MDGGGRRSKGARGELEVCRLLQPWWRRLEPAAVFARTGDLGRMPMDRRLHGDLHVQHAPRWRHHVEVKRREGWDRARWLRGAHRSPVWGWWAQACGEAAVAGQPPMLWLRRSREAWIVVVPLVPPLPCPALAIFPRALVAQAAVVHGPLLPCAALDEAALLGADPGMLALPAPAAP